MSIGLAFTIALKALRRNALRTALTALGIIIGVAAVIVMTAIGAGAQQAIEAQIRSAGSNIVIVSAGSASSGPLRLGQGNVTTLTAADADAIRAEVPGIRHLVPGLNLRTQIVGDAANWGTQVQGTGPDLPDVRSWPMEIGAFFSEQDVTRAARVVVLGSVVRDQLFGSGADPTGAVVRIRNQPFRVVGVLTRKGQAAMGPDQDDVAMVPFSTAQKRLLGVSHIQNVTISAEEGVALDALSAGVSATLRRRHRTVAGEDDDFAVRTMEEMASVLTSTTTTMRYLLASIAIVSLVVGGIGIMNIMLVSVTERTKEIGLRLAVGARDRDVLAQFLIEAVVLSVAGGLAGILTGAGVARLLGRLMEWPTPVMPDAVALAFLCALGIGILFGFFPARRAARLDPITALRYE